MQSAEVRGRGQVQTRVCVSQNSPARCSLCRSAFAGESFSDARGALWVRRFHAVEQTVGAGLEELAQPGERRQSDGVTAPLDIADCLPMHANQLGQTLLGHVGFQARLADMAANQSQNLMICHAPQRKGCISRLTPRKHSIKKIALFEKESVF